MSGESWKPTDDVSIGEGENFGIVRRKGRVILQSSEVPILDFDIIHPSHKRDDGCFASNIGEALTLLQERLNEYFPDESFAIHQTVGGLRVFPTTFQAPPTDVELMLKLEAMGVDRYYLKLCRNTQRWNVRVSFKPERKGDRYISMWIANHSPHPPQKKDLEENMGFIRLHNRLTRYFEGGGKVRSLLRNIKSWGYPLKVVNRNEDKGKAWWKNPISSLLKLIA